MPHLSRSTAKRCIQHTACLFANGALKHMLYLSQGGKPQHVQLLILHHWNPHFKSPKTSRNSNGVGAQGTSRRLSGNKPPLSTWPAVEGCHVTHWHKAAAEFGRPKQIQIETRLIFQFPAFKGNFDWTRGFIQSNGSSWRMMLHCDSNPAFKGILHTNLVTNGASKARVTIFCCNEATPAHLHRTSWS